MPIDGPPGANRKSRSRATDWFRMHPTIPNPALSCSTSQLIDVIMRIPRGILSTRRGKIWAIRASFSDLESTLQQRNARAHRRKDTLSALEDHPAWHPRSDRRHRLWLGWMDEPFPVGLFISPPSAHQSHSQLSGFINLLAAHCMVASARRVPCLQRTDCRQEPVSKIDRDPFRFAHRRVRLGHERTREARQDLSKTICNCKSCQF